MPGEEICVHLLLLSNKHFCRVGRYGHASRQLRTAIHLASVGQKLNPVNQKLGMDVHFGGSGGGDNVQESRYQILIRSLSYAIK